MWIAVGIVVFAACELAFYYLVERQSLDLPAVASNLSMGVVSGLLRRATFPLRVSMFALAYQLTPLRIAPGFLAAVGCYLGVDFLLYWLHRWLHETELGWALHSVHHSSDQYNLSLGVRTHWLQNLVDDAFYLPLPLLGFPPLLAASMLELNRLAQYWPHTRMLGRLAWLDPWLNTPSNHRVHHALLPGGVRRNYGSNFMLWDRLFGTYAPESGPLVFGTDDAAPDVLNPLRIQFEGLWRYWQRRRRAGSWDGVLRALYSAWFCVWFALYARYFGWQFVLWFCCLANVYLLVGLWRRTALWFSLAAVSVLPIQLAYSAELASRWLFGVRLHGATDYLFDPTIPEYIRGLSLFHVFVPVLIVYALIRHGYDQRAFWLQSAIALAMLCVCYFGFDPLTQTNDASMPTLRGVGFDRDFNLNWVHGLHDAPAPAGRELEVFLTVLIGYPLCVHWPVHWLLCKVGLARPAVGAAT